jgi:hypothetical protein
MAEGLPKTNAQRVAQVDSVSFLVNSIAVGILVIASHQFKVDTHCRQKEYQW